MWDYYLDPTLREHKLVKDELEKIIQTEEILTSTVIWMEVAHYLYKVSKLPRHVLEQRIENFTGLSTMTVAESDLNLLYESLKLLSETWAYPIHGRDATILAIMRKKGIRRIFTHDKGFKELAKQSIVEVLDPVSQRA